MTQAKALGLTAIGIADRNTVAGVVRAHAAAKAEGLQLIVGARIDTVPQSFAPRQKDGRNEKLAESPMGRFTSGFFLSAVSNRQGPHGGACAAC